MIMDQSYFLLPLWLFLLSQCVLPIFGDIDERQLKSRCAPFYGYEPFKNLKCLKAQRLKQPIKSYENAQGYCFLDNGHLPIIDFKDKQQFLEEFIKRKEVNEDVWIGLTNRDENHHHWADGTESYYSNWGTGYPVNDSKYCPQMKVDKGANFGKWSYGLCKEKRQWIVCEIIQRWKYEQFHTFLHDSIKNAIPIGFIYAQLPFTQSPTEIWPFMGWIDISDEYNSTFFRVLGDKSANFGELQEASARKLIFYLSDSRVIGNTTPSMRYPGIHVPDAPKWSPSIEIPSYAGAVAYTHYVHFSIGTEEPIPVNMAMRIWKREY